MRRSSPVFWNALAAFSAVALPLAAVAAPPPPAAVAKPAPTAAPVPTRVVGQLVLEAVPEVPKALAERMLQYQNARAARLFDWDADGKGLLLGTRFGETQQLHAIRQPGGARKQLTFFGEPVGSALLRRVAGGKPETREVLLSQDVGGSENYQLSLWRAADGQTRLLTDGKSRHESALWSRKGDRLAYVGTGRNGRDFDIYVADPSAAPATTPLAEVEGQWRILDWSPDDSQLLVMRSISIEDSQPHVLDVATGKLRRLLADRQDKKIAYGTMRWGSGGSVWLTSDEAGEFVSLGRLDPPAGSQDAAAAGAKLTWVSATIPWKIEEVRVSRDLKRIAFTANEDGYSSLYLASASGSIANTADGKPKRVTTLPQGVVQGLEWRPDGKALALALTTPTSSGDLYTLEDGKPAPVRWTESEVGGLPESALRAPTLVRYPTFDEVGGKPRQIPAFYYKGKGNGPRPFVVMIHGGPEAQARPVFDPTVQFWVNDLGLSVLIPNVRGSDGYGKTYLGLDNGMKREDSVNDIGALLDWAKGQPDLNSARAAVYGGSYGGYMVLACLARFPERFQAGIDIVGISNFVTFLENTKEYRRDLRRVEYGDERQREMRGFLERISPTNLTKHIRAKLFVIQGANDPRVPASEAEQIVREVRKTGQDVWYMLAKDEGHGFQKKGNRDAMGQAVALFWERYLGVGAR